MRKIILSLFLFQVCSSAKDLTLVLVGGGEAPGPITTVDQQLNAMTELAKKNKETAEFHFLSTQGYAERDKLLKNYQSQSLTQENLKLEIQNMKKKMDSMKEGDLVSVVVLAHGQRASRSQSKWTHEISAHKDDRSFNDPSGYIDLDFLKDLSEYASQKKLKMAIVDTSCYSGETLKIAKLPGLEKTCVISASSDHGTSNARVSLQLLQGLADGTDLQSGYLNGRKASEARLRYFSGIKISTLPAFPQISDPIGTFLSEEFFPKLFRYLREPSLFNRQGFDDDLRKNMRTFFSRPQKTVTESQVGCSEESCLSTQDEFQKMNQILSQLLLKIDLSSLQEKTKAYMAQVKIYDDLIEKLQMQVNSEATSMEEEVSKKTSNLSSVQKKLIELAGEVAAEERKIYELVYRDIQSKIDKGEIQAPKSPCQEMSWSKTMIK